MLVKRIRGAMRGRMETSNGYVFKLDSKMVTLPEAAEWMGMERLCCPFLTLQLAASGNQAAWRYDAHRPRRREILSSTSSFRHVELAMPS